MSHEHASQQTPAEQVIDKLDRYDIARDAALDIDVLVNLLRKQTRSSRDPEELELLLVASFHHLTSFNNVVLCALSGDNRLTVDEMKEVVHG
jgi:hypothetical protein